MLIKHRLYVRQYIVVDTYNIYSCVTRLKSKVPLLKECLIAILWRACILGHKMLKERKMKSKMQNISNIAMRTNKGVPYQTNNFVLGILKFQQKKVDV